VNETRTKTEELLVERLMAGRLNTRADLQEAERAARDLGLRKLAKRALKTRRKLTDSSRTNAPGLPGPRYSRR